MGVPFALASKTGGEGEGCFFFVFFNLTIEIGRSWQVHLYGEAARVYFFLFFFPQRPVGAGAPIW